MSPPPLRVYAVVWLLLGVVLGGAAWLLWKRPWTSVAAGVAGGFAGLLLLVALGPKPRDPGRDPHDPGA